MTDSSDEDSFHSASDGESELSSVSSHNSPKVTEFSDSKETKESNNGFENVECQSQSSDEKGMIESEMIVVNAPSEEEHIFAKPKPKISASSSTSSSKKEQESPSPLADSEDDDWFKTQMEEFKKPKINGTKQVKKSGTTAKSEIKKQTIWDWTGIHEVVNAVGEGFSNVVESGLGLPNPEDMAKLSVAERRKLVEEAQHMKEPEPSLSSDEGLGPDRNLMFKTKKSFHKHKPSGEETLDPNGGSSQASPSASGSGGGLFSTSLFSGIVSGSLDMLETLGKKTFETLTVKDESAGDRRRFFLRPDSAEQSLSELLREIRENKADSDSTKSSLYSAAEKFNTNFVSLFEKNGGMVHLEGLELLSNDQEKRNAFGTCNSFDEMLLEFCVEDVSECSTDDFNTEFAKSVHFISLPYKPDDVLEVDKTLTQELSLRQSAVDNNEEVVVDAIHEAAITALAKLTAHSIQALHKLAQLIIIAKNLPEMESLFAFTYLLCRRLSFFATQYTNILNLVESSNRVDEVVTNIFFECSNACHYVKKALELLRPFFAKP